MPVLTTKQMDKNIQFQHGAVAQFQGHPDADTYRYSFYAS